jgi:hypothetical protein
MPTLLDAQRRQIRNIQIVRSDIFPLITANDKEKKLFGTTINAYGAHFKFTFLT